MPDIVRKPGFEFSVIVHFSRPNPATPNGSLLKNGFVFGFRHGLFPIVSCLFHKEGQAFTNVLLDCADRDTIEFRNFRIF